MLAVAVDLLTGRYAATAHDDRSRAEWPPHPARLFSALVAAWADADEPDPAERAVLGWLETQPPPALAGRATMAGVAERLVLTSYVPVNDVTVLRSPAAVDARAGRLAAAEAALRDTTDARTSAAARQAVTSARAAYRAQARSASAPSGKDSPSVRATVLGILPEGRNRQPRTFPSVTPAEPTVWFVWPDTEPSQAQRAVLDAVLARVGRIGHSSTLVSCRLDEAPPPVALSPDPAGGHLLRVPRAGLLDRLERDFASHQGRRERVMPAAVRRYAPPARPRPVSPAGNLAGDWILLPLRATDRGRRMPSVGNVRTLQLARAVRAALLAHGAADTGVLSGLWPDGAHRPHAAVVPLASVGHAWADGTVRGVALVLPALCPQPDRQAVDGAVHAWYAAGAAVTLPGRHTDQPVEFDNARVVPPGEFTPAGDGPVALQRSTWCRPAQDWVSVTPLALDTHPGPLFDARPQRRLPAEETARAGIAASCRRYGLPEPEHVTLSPAGMTTAVPPARGGGPGRPAFPGFTAAGTGQPRLTVHAALRFPTPVAGPVLLGAGRYLGYGLFLPSPDPAGGPR